MCDLYRDIQIDSLKPYFSKQNLEMSYCMNQTYLADNPVTLNGSYDGDGWKALAIELA